ncbi:MAG: hypothetical protein IJ491_07825 [Clostridia bacterium]|nr:hypothetical protein [Clostridia bacterium]
MFSFFKTRKNSKATKNNSVFQGKGFIDVTNFDAMSPDDSLGYACVCDIVVFQNGLIEIFSDNNERNLLESFSVLNIVTANNNINNYAPETMMGVSVITENKGLRIFFQTKESKIEFWNALTTTYDNLKER